MKLRIGFFICTFLIPTMFVHGVVRADDTPVELPCLEEIGKDQTFLNKLDELYGQESGPLSNVHIKAYEKDLYSTIGDLFFKKCNYADWNTLVDASHFAFNFNFKDHDYHITINSDALFTRINRVRTLIFMAPSVRRTDFPIITADASDSDRVFIENDLPTDIYFPKECSTHTPFSPFRKGNTYVNITGRNMFNSGYSTKYYFIGIGRGASYKNFKGLLYSIASSSSPQPETFSNFIEGRKKLKEFAAKLSEAGSACQNFILYLVTFDENTEKITILSEPIIIGN